MRTRVDLTGMKFSRLVVVSFDGRDSRYSSRWLCACDCGNMTVANGSHLKSGHTQSCGCLHKDRASEAKTKHGRRHSSEYNIWTKMKSRCFNKNDPAYKNYGGRGISMCESWVLSFEEFFLHMGPRPSSKHSIDRYPDNNGNYDPGNCRWATDIEQANNKRNNFMIAVDGETMTASGWSLRTGISQKTIKLRIVRYGWTPREAVGIDPRPHRRSALFGEYERRTS